MVVRIDDVNPNTDFNDLYEQLELLREIFDEIILGINVFGKTSSNGSVYPNLPLSDQHRKYFYNVDKFFDMDMLESLISFPKVTIVSHGLLHGKHGHMGQDAVEMSILTSCNFLGTNKFIPPFNGVSQLVEQVCRDNYIDIIGNTKDITWKSLETEKFDSSHKYWYYHPWRIDSVVLNSKLGVRVI